MDRGESSDDIDGTEHDLPKIKVEKAYNWGRRGVTGIRYSLY